MSFHWLFCGMKTLLLVRHAKSSWADPGTDDFDRPLNDRGKKDAPDMARRLRALEAIPDLLITSAAKRARKTAEAFAEELDISKKDIIELKELYLAGRLDFVSAIKKIPDTSSVVAIFSHNPGITEFANSLTNTRVDDMPTCSIYALTIDTEKWRDFESAHKQFLFFNYPKLA